MRTVDVDLEHHGALGWDAKRDHRTNDSHSNDSPFNDGPFNDGEADDVRRKTTAAFHRATARTAAEARHRLSGGGMTGARTKATR